MKRRLRILRPLLVSALLVIALAPVAAPGETGWSYDLASHLMSPYCPGRTLVDCTSPQAAELRDWITAQEQAGVSREEVERKLYLEFGDTILQAPKASGFGLAAYVIPGVAFLVGGAVVLAFLRRQGSSPVPAAPAAPALDPELERRIDDELQRGSR
jgi:cytochrome c-type biogenesis protein CcmH/NrfF